MLKAKQHGLLILLLASPLILTQAEDEKKSFVINLERTLIDSSDAKFNLLDRYSKDPKLNQATDQKVQKQSKKLKERLRASDQSFDIDNSNNYVYMGYIYVGSEKQELKAWFDTGVDYTIVQSSNCLTCPGVEFNETASSTFLNMSSYIYEYYKGVSAYGYIVNDTVSLDSTQTYAVTNFQFLDSTSFWPYVTVSELDAVLGMCRAGTSTGPLFINYLYSAGKITSKVFAFYLSNFQDQSTLEIGGYTLAKMKDTSDLVYPTLSSSTYWLVNIEGIRFGSTSTFSDGSNSAYYTPSTYAIIETSLNSIYIPYDIYDQFMELVLKDITTYDYNGDVYVGPCDRSQYNSIFLYIDSVYYEIDPYTYVLDYNGGKRGYCQIAIEKTWSTSYWILGATFLKNYYTIFDDANNQLGLSPHVTSNATIEKSATKSSSKFNYYNSYYCYDYSSNYYDSSCYGYYYGYGYNSGDVNYGMLFSFAKSIIGLTVLLAGIAATVFLVFTGLGPNKSLKKLPNLQEKSLFEEKMIFKSKEEIGSDDKNRIVIIRL